MHVLEPTDVVDLCIDDDPLQVGEVRNVEITIVAT